MRSLGGRRPLLVGTLAVLVLLSGLALAVGRAASVPPTPSVSAEELIESTLRTIWRLPPVSGEMAVRLDLGIPSVNLPGQDAAEWLSGEHRLRVWKSRDGMRVADLLQVGERSLVVNRGEAWAWDSEAFTAYRLRLPRHPGAHGAPGHPHAPPSPGDLLGAVRWILTTLEPTTAVRVAPARILAGRPVYTLRIVPRSPATTVGTIEVSIDAEHRLPLAVAIYPRGGGAAAASAAFTSVDFGPIDPSVFAFSPPSGAKIEDVRAGDVVRAATILPGLAMFHGTSVRTFGRGWDRVLAVRTPPPSSLGGGGPGVRIPTLFPLSGPLLSARLVDRGDHGWMMIGAVRQARLAALEDRLP